MQGKEAGRQLRSRRKDVERDKELMRWKMEVKNTRKDMKRYLRVLEREW